jgi:hypothetical protein
MPEITYVNKIVGDQEVVARLDAIKQQFDHLGRSGPEAAKKTKDAFLAIGEGSKTAIERFDEQEAAIKKLTDSFDKALNPSRDLGNQIRLLGLDARSSSDIWAVYGDRLIKAAEATRKNGQEIDPAVAGMLEFGNATGKTGLSFESLGKCLTEFAQNPLEATKNGINAMLTSLGPTAVGFGAVSTAAVIASAALYKFAAAASENSERLENLSAMTGMAVADLQALERITTEAGLGSLDLGRNISFMNQELARDPKQFREGLDKLALSVKDSSGQTKDAITLLSEMGKRLQSIEDPSEQAQVALGVLGIRYRELVPLLINMNGSLQENIDKMKEAGFVYSEATQKALLDFNNRLDAIGRVWQGTKTEFTATIAALLDFAAAASKASPALTVFGAALALTVGGTAGLKLFNAVIGDTADAASNLGKEIGDVGPSMGMFYEILADRVGKAAEAAKKAADAQEKLNEAFSNAVARNYISMQADVNRVLADGVKVADRMNEQFLNLHDDGIAKLLATLAPNGPMNSYFDQLGRNARAELDAINKAAGNSAVTDAIMRGAREAARFEDDLWIRTWNARQDYALDRIENIKESAGNIFDAMLTRGKSAFRNLGDWIEATFLTRLRSMFQSLMGWLFGGMQSGFGGLLNAIGAGGNGSLFSKGLGVLGLGNLFGGTASAATSIGLSAAEMAALQAINPMNSVVSGVLGTSAGVGGAAAGSGGAMGSLSAFLTNPYTIGVAAAAALGYLGFKLFKGHDAYEAGSMESKRDFKVELSKDDMKSIYASLGLSEDQAYGIRKDILSSPVVLQKMGAIAKAQGGDAYEKFLTSLEQIETAWGNFDFRKAFELGNATGDWSELNAQFEDAFEHSAELQRIMPNWRQQLDALGSSTDSLTTSLTEFRDALEGSITPVETMYDKFLSTGEITEEFAAQITKLGGDIEKFKKLANLTVELGGLQESLTFIQSLSAALENLAPNLDPINQILSGNLGSEAVDALMAAGLDPERFTSLSRLIGMEKQWDSIAKPFATLQAGGALENALLEFGGAAGRIAVERYYQGQNTITQGLLDSTKAAMDKAYQDQIKSALAYIGTVEKETVDKMNTLIESINAAKSEVVQVLDRILAALTGSTSPEGSSAGPNVREGGLEPGSPVSPELFEPNSETPRLAKGGWVEKTGWAVVHEGEEYRRGGGGGRITYLTIDLRNAQIKGIEDVRREFAEAARQYFHGGGSLQMLDAR